MQRKLRKPRRKRKREKKDDIDEDLLTSKLLIVACILTSAWLQMWAVSSGAQDYKNSVTSHMYTKSNGDSRTEFAPCT